VASLLFATIEDKTFNFLIQLGWCLLYANLGTILSLDTVSAIFPQNSGLLEIVLLADAEYFTFKVGMMIF